MATLVLGAVGAAVGGSVGGSILGLSGAVIGRAVGSVLGRVVDQTLVGRGSEAVDHGKVDRFRLTGASEGAPLPRVVGRMRVGGQIIWATRFKEHVEVTTSGGGGKGAPKPPSQQVTTYRYTASFAMALCEGEIRRVGRVWADGREVSPHDMDMRVYTGSEDQLPDPLIEAIDGVGRANAFRGTAYVVFEDLDIGAFGNRVPQMSFEVVRAAEGSEGPQDVATHIEGVALVPGTGEYALATRSVHFDYGTGGKDSANVNTVLGRPDFSVALSDMVEELPKLGAASLVVSWFGDDLRCGQCSIRPKVEQTEFDGKPMPWRVSGLRREDAEAVPRPNERPIYGGTPSDRSVVDAILAMHGKGLDVTFYPFILMDQLTGNGLPDPWGGEEQAVLPWRGRITTDLAPDQPGTTDGTAAAEAEVAAFFGAAVAEDFTVPPLSDEAGLTIGGPGEWSFSHFILHYAALCAHAGGVEAFCIGSEMRSLTRIRGADGSFPAVERMRSLAREVRKLLPDAKIGYAADWSEYGGYTPPGTQDLRFPLDALWGDEDVDFIGIDNYIPLSDWRDGSDHADADHGAIYDLSYLQSNIEGGEGYDWYYPTPEAREVQRRIEITDGAENEPWVFRYKDIRAWWSNAHFERIDGVRQAEATAWEPMSKEIRFTEYGCAAVDKGTNQPNKFVDPKSSESSLPRYSNGRRDDTIQMQYIRAMATYYETEAHNPISPIYGAPMLDWGHSFVWAWDARPYPAFPDLLEFWSDGENYRRGHWVSGRSALQPLASVVDEICARAGLTEVDTSEVFGVVRGYAPSGIQTARAELQPLMLAHGLTVSEQDGRLRFGMQARSSVHGLSRDGLVRTDGAVLEAQRTPEAEVTGRVLVEHVDAEGEFQTRVGEAVQPGTEAVPVSSSELPLALTVGEGAALAERFLAESRISRDSLEFALPPSVRDVHPGDLVRFDDRDETWRVDRLDEGSERRVQAVRTEVQVFEPSDAVEDGSGRARPLAPLPVDAIFMDLPLLTEESEPHAPYVAVSARPWPGAVAIYASGETAGFTLNRRFDVPSIVGVTETVLEPAAPGLWDRGPELVVTLPFGTLEGVTTSGVLGGANAAAIGTGEPDGWEIVQFRDVRLVGENQYALSMRLRGQRGTEVFSRAAWPAGSRFVLLNEGLQQLSLRQDFVGLERYYRYGPGALSVDNEAYIQAALALGGGGQVPFAPVHLRLTRGMDQIGLAWIRRTRLFFNDWAAGRAPLGEERELYEVKVLNGAGDVLENQQRSETSAEWSENQWDELLSQGAVRLTVAQISNIVGPGHAAVLEIAA